MATYNIQTLNTDIIGEAILAIRPTGQIKLGAIGKHGGAPLVIPFYMPEQLDEALEFCEKHKDKNLYYELNPPKYSDAKKSSEKDIEAVVGFCIDLDPDCSDSYETGRQELLNIRLEAVNTFPVEPWLVIDSGNGLQIIYLLNEPSTDFDRCKQIGKSLSKQFGGDATYSLDHLFRLPGTINYPNKNKLDKGYPAEPTVSTIIGNNEVACSIAELEKSLEWIQSGIDTITSSNMIETVPVPNMVSEDEILHRLGLNMKRNSKLRDRWNGDTSGLQDTSRSGMDFSMASFLKHRGFSFEEAHYLLGQFEHGKLAEKEAAGDMQYFNHMWEKIAPPPASDRMETIDVPPDFTRSSANDDTYEPLFTPEEASIGHFIQNDPPERQYLLEDCLPLGKVGAIIGQGGTSKSTLAMQISIGIATGSDPCDGAWKTATTGQVLCLFAEEDTNEIHRRIYNFTRDLSDDDKKKVEKNLFVKSMVARDNLITAKSEQSSEVHATDYLIQLLRTIEQFIDLKLIIIDPASRFRGGDENAAQDTTRFVEALEQLSQLTGATVLIIHHANKASTSNSSSQNSARGSSAFVDGLRWVMEVRTMNEDEFKKKQLINYSRYHFMSARVVKNNYAPPQGEDIWLLRGENGLLSHAPYIDGFKNMQDELRNKEIIRTLSTDADNGEFHSLTSFKDKYAGKDNKFHMGKDTLNKLIATLIEEGKLVLKPATAEQKATNKNLRDVLLPAT